MSTLITLFHTSPQPARSTITFPFCLTYCSRILLHRSKSNCNWVPKTSKPIKWRPGKTPFHKYWPTRKRLSNVHLRIYEVKYVFSWVLNAISLIETICYTTVQSSLSLAGTRINASLSWFSFPAAPTSKETCPLTVLACGSAHSWHAPRQVWVWRIWRAGPSSISPCLKTVTYWWCPLVLYSSYCW